MAQARENLTDKSSMTAFRQMPLGQVPFSAAGLVGLSTFAGAAA